MAQVEFRFATPSDAGLVLDFLKQLAAYESMPDGVTVGEEQVRAYLAEPRKAEVVFAIVNGEEVGFALFFDKFLAWTGKANLYLEDLFVLPEHRGKGYGKALMGEVARIACSRGCARVEWVCLSWNKPSLDFYHSLGAQDAEGWTMLRFEGEALKRMSDQKGAVPN